MQAQELKDDESVRKQLLENVELDSGMETISWRTKRPFDATDDSDKYLNSIKAQSPLSRTQGVFGSPSASSSSRPWKQLKLSDYRETPSPQKRKRPAVIETIEISSDDDEEIELLRPDQVETQLFNKKRKHQPVRPNAGSREDSEDEYHATLPIDDCEIWKHDPIHTLTERVNRIRVAHTPPNRTHRPLNTHSNYFPPSIPNRGKGKLYLWDECSHALRFPQSVFRRESVRVPTRQSPIVRNFKKAAGSINQVVQHKGKIAMCSAASGGHEDQAGEEHNPYNTQAALVLWDENLNSHVLEGHWSIKKSGRTRYKKFYTVNSVAFDPHSPAFVSSATDKSIIVWAPNQRQDSPEDAICSCIEPGIRHYYDAVPHDLVFLPHPRQSLLAVAEQNITIHKSIHSPNSRFSLAIVPRESANLHSVGAICWGTGPTFGHLFASSEPNNNDPSNILENGFHKAFDIQSKQALFTFDATEGGDALTLNPLGGLVALCTRTESQNFLRIYDVERKLGKAQKTVTLQPHEGLEVNCAAFSPDGLYLAIARSDNHTHVYDTRMLGAEALHDFEHNGLAQSSPGHGAYGVVHAEWTESSATNRLGLVTGGQDGFVRLWHPLQGSDKENGRILGEASADIGHFSLGDRFNGEHELVIGDGDGGLYVLDGLGDF